MLRRRMQEAQRASDAAKEQRRRRAELPIAVQERRGHGPRRRYFTRDLRSRSRERHRGAPRDRSDSRGRRFTYSGSAPPRSPEREQMHRRSHRFDRSSPSARRRDRSPARRRERSPVRRSNRSPSPSPTPDCRPSSRRAVGPIGPARPRQQQAGPLRSFSTAPLLRVDDERRVEPNSEQSGFSDAASAKGFDRIRTRVVGSLTAPFYGGPSPGPLTESNCAVLFEEKLRGAFRTLESGVVALEHDQMVDGVWMTVPDQYTRRRNEFLSELVQDHLATRDLMESAEIVEVWSITGGEVFTKPRQNVTCIDWLRLLVREQALTNVAKELASDALEAVSRKPSEAWAAAAARVLKVFI